MQIIRWVASRHHASTSQVCDAFARRELDVKQITNTQRLRAAFLPMKTIIDYAKAREKTLTLENYKLFTRAHSQQCIHISDMLQHSHVAVSTKHVIDCTQKCKLLNLWGKEVREISRIYVAPPRVFAPAVWAAHTSSLPKNTSTSVYEPISCHPKIAHMAEKNIYPRPIIHKSGMQCSPITVMPTGKCNVLSDENWQYKWADLSGWLKV